MSGKEVIAIEKRNGTNSRLSRKLRNEGYLTASISGKGIESISVKVKEDEFRKALSSYGRNHLFNLDLAGEKTYTILVKEIQHSPISRKMLNVDFQAISLTEEAKADLEIRIIGKEIIDSKRLNLVRQMDNIPVRGLPQDIPDYIEIDVSKLDMGDKVDIGDLIFPKGIVADIDADKTVISVKAPTLITEDEEEAVEENN
jgi:large subunit ribosomal protein L25